MLVQPFGFLQGVTAAGPTPPPVSGYLYFFDFGDPSTITLSGTNIVSMTDSDGVITLTPRSGYNAVYDAANYRLDGAASTNGYYLADNGTAVSSLFTGFPVLDYDYTMVLIINEDASRNFPVGMRCDSNKRWDMFMNDSAGRRDFVFGGQTFVSGITNDTAKDTVLFAVLEDQGASASRRWLYRWGLSESSAGPDNIGIPAADANAFRIGATSRNSLLPAPSYQGYVYAVLLYRSFLNATERSDIVTWATTRYNLTLQS